MKNWMLISLIVLGTVNAKAQMSVNLRDATPEDQIAVDDEMDSTFNDIDRNEQRRKSREQAQQRTAQQQAYLAGQRDALMNQSPTPAAPQRRVVRRTTTYTVAQQDPSQYQAPVRRATNPPPQQYQQQPVYQQPTYSQRELQREWINPTRRTGITIIPTVQVGMATTSSDYISQTATGGSLSHSSKVDWGLGVMAEFGRSMLTFETGVMYFQEQIDASYSFNNNYYYNFNYGQTSSLTDDATLNYVGIPLIGKLNFGPASQSGRFHVSAGFIPAFLISNTFSYQQNSTYGSIATINDANSSYLSMGGFREFNIFSSVGVGGDFSVGTRKDLRAELTWRRNLMSETNNTTTTVDAFLLSIGFGFDI